MPSDRTPNAVAQNLRGGSRGFSRSPAGRPNQDISINVGILVASIFAWDLGNNVGVSDLAAVHVNDFDGDRGSLLGAMPVLPQLSSNTYRQGFAISYTGDGLNLTYRSPPFDRALGLRRSSAKLA